MARYACVKTSNVTDMYDARAVLIGIIGYYKHRWSTLKRAEVLEAGRGIACMVRREREQHVQYRPSPLPRTFGGEFDGALDGALDRTCSARWLESLRCRSAKAVADLFSLTSRFLTSSRRWNSSSLSRMCCLEGRQSGITSQTFARFASVRVHIMRMRARVRARHTGRDSAAQHPRTVLELLLLFLSVAWDDSFDELAEEREHNIFAAVARVGPRHGRSPFPIPPARHAACRKHFR